MNELFIPELLEGDWQHALILTYGIDIPFFEGPIWRQFDANCRNKVVLADGKRFLAACSTYSQPGVIRHLNRAYVADGILLPQSMHAKAILLTNEQRGRLLVGSGNLSMQGFASGGELFARYELGPKQVENLGAFLAVREILDELLQMRHLGVAAVQRIQHMYEGTPWLFWADTGASRPIRHNLQQGFLDQLGEVVGGEAVQELYILSPFYDPDGAGLAGLLQMLRPQHVTILVQPDQVSMNPVAIQQVLDEHTAHVTILPFTRGDDNRYIHAKCYLLVTATRSVCLHGSPNLSRVAMLRSCPHGNLEIASLLTGECHDFDYLLDGLNCGPEATRLTEIITEARFDDEGDFVAGNSWYLTRGEVDGRTLTLHYHGVLPDLRDAKLLLGNNAFALEVEASKPHRLQLSLNDEELQLLERTTPICLQWSNEPGSSASNPIYACHLAVLRRALQESEEDSRLPRLGALDLGDEEFEKLLHDLDSTLIVDQLTVWQLAGRTPTNDHDQESGAEGLPISLSDIDYEQIRRHPRVQQYLRRHGAVEGYSQSRLQVILNSIAEHFEGMVGSKPVPSAGASEPGGDGVPLETEEEAEEAEKARQARRWSARQRIRRVLINFVRRYIRAIRTREFQRLVGSDVMAHNYVIFSHLLWRLLAKDWVEAEFTLGALADIWQLFWGSDRSGRDGYWAGLLDEELQAANKLIEAYHTFGQTLAALYVATEQLRHGAAQRDLLLRLRDQLRNLLLSQPAMVTEDTLTDAWFFASNIYNFNPPRPGRIAETIKWLADFETRQTFAAALEKRLQLAEHSCWFDDKVTVQRPAIGRTEKVTCLYMGAGAQPLDVTTATTILREWLRIEPNLGYYRVSTHEKSQMAFYDTKGPGGWYWDEANQVEEELGGQEPLAALWDGAIQRLSFSAGRLDAPSSVTAVANALQQFGHVGS